MGKINRIIKIKDVLYECLGVMSVESSNEKGTEYWKEKMADRRRKLIDGLVSDAIE